MRAAADAKGDEPPLNRERIAGQHAGLSVFAVHVIAGRRSVRVDHTRPLSADVTLVIGDIRDLDRFRSEGRSLDGPALVSL